MANAMIEIAPKEKMIYRFFGILGLLGIALGFSTGQFIISAAIIISPLVLIMFRAFMNSPIILLYGIFTANFFIMGLTRYAEFSGISVIMDSMFGLLLFIIFIHTVVLKNLVWKNVINSLSIMTFAWMIFCLLEIVNPSGMFEAWISSRTLIFNGFLITLVSSLIIVNFKQVRILIMLYSIFVLLAVAKSLMQKYIGFDAAEQRWLDNGGALTHLIVTGTRYFSFFTDAGNYGSNMGCACVLFLILSFVKKEPGLKIYFLIVSLLSGYGMFISGTRGAMIVPLGGLVMYVLLSRNFKAMISGTILLVGVYVFFAFTTIGQDNATIRRMRTSFNPSEDNSFNVRQENQKKLGEYLKNKPFGEGLGLSGVENQKTSMRFTTQIPHDSWYVKLWVETGIVGLSLYIAVLLIVAFNCAYIIMFKVDNREAKGYYIAMLSGCFGLMLSAYGNAFFGQFPTMIIVFIFLSIILKGKILASTIPDEGKLA